MKKSIKIILGIIIVVTLTIIIDLVCIFWINRPIFAQSEDYGTYAVYKGLFFDTYNCVEYSVPQIKMKGTKFSCANVRIDIGKVVDIIDKTKNIKDFVCAEALEGFYEDENYQYYYSCIKGKYIVVKYENGYEEKVSDALKYGTITIFDLDKYNIDYIKYDKKEVE